MPKVSTIDFSLMPEDDIALISRFGDREAFEILWQRAIPQVERIAGRFTGKYPWIEHDDLTQNILVAFPKIVARYDPWRAKERRITWNKYLYFAFYRAAQDALRREDPLGVGIPQKARYPAWCRLSEISDSQNLIESIVLDGIAAIDRGEACVLGSGVDEITMYLTSLVEPEEPDNGTAT